MNKRKILVGLAFLVAFGCVVLAAGKEKAQAYAGPDLRLRFFEGITEGTAETAKVITSSFLHSTITASIQSEEDLVEEQKQIKKTFNLKEVKLVTEAVLKRPAKESEKISHLLRLDGKQYLILVTPVDRTRMRQFRVEIFEQSNEKKMNLLDTEVILPAKNMAIFGFEDTLGKPYFLSLRAPLTGVMGDVEGGVLGGVEGGVLGGVEGGAAGGVETPGKATAMSEVSGPRLYKKVNPVYPYKARMDRIEGYVDVEATTDIYGRVRAVKILRSIPKLDQAVIDAVKQWVYEPAVIDGKPKEVTFRVSYRFRFDGKKEKVEANSEIVGPGQAVTVSAQEVEEFEKGAVRCIDGIEPPKLVKKVNPVYPEIARRAGVEGVVILEIKTDAAGRVQAAKILRSIPLLDQAAIDAVKQWAYEPLIIEGVPKPALFTVTVNFRLDGEKAAKSAQAIEEFAAGAVKVEGEVKPPKLIKIIEPVYPEVARVAGVEGVVILQARIDVSGKVKDAMILRSIPLLNQAAIDAVRQWVYEPLIIKGKPMEAVFTVTVRFELNDKEKKDALAKAGELERGAVRATGEVNPPRIIKKVNPVYPEEARKAGIEGIVILEAMTDEKGNVVRVKILNSIPELDQAAIDALKQWKYEPAIIDGKPRPIVFTVTIRFSLK